MRYLRGMVLTAILASILGCASTYRPSRPGETEVKFPISPKMREKYGIHRNIRDFRFYWRDDGDGVVDGNEITYHHPNLRISREDVLKAYQAYLERKKEEQQD